MTSSARPTERWPLPPRCRSSAAAARRAWAARAGRAAWPAPRARPAPARVPRPRPARIAGSQPLRLRRRRRLQQPASAPCSGRRPAPPACARRARHGRASAPARRPRARGRWPATAGRPGSPCPASACSRSSARPPRGRGRAAGRARWPATGRTPGRRRRTRPAARRRAGRAGRGRTTSPAAPPRRRSRPGRAAAQRWSRVTAHDLCPAGCNASSSRWISWRREARACSSRRRDHSSSARRTRSTGRARDSARMRQQRARLAADRQHAGAVRRPRLHRARSAQRTCDVPRDAASGQADGELHGRTYPGVHCRRSPEAMNTVCRLNRRLVKDACHVAVPSVSYRCSQCSAWVGPPARSRQRVEVAGLVGPPP